MEIKNPEESEQPQRDKYGIPMANVQVYVDRAVRELGVDPSLVNDTDSTMFAWHLDYQVKNVEVARRLLNMPDASLSQLARAMADANSEVTRQIETDPDYYIPPPAQTE